MNDKNQLPFGLIIGKFLPPHRGHHHLIDTARSQVENLIVLVGERENDFIPGELRASWLREMHPGVEVRVIEDRYDQDDSKLWAKKTIGWLGRAPDVVFTSENYGPVWAGFLGCEHVMVDLERNTFPVSATKVREDVMSNWQFLSPPVRGHFAKRIVVLGAESTGSTTLALDLAGALNTVWVPEYGRDYCIPKFERGDQEWSSEEFLAIAREQIRRENALAKEANKILVCDTDAFATRLWHWRYCGNFAEELDALVEAHRKPDLYILTDTDIPFVQDGIRDGEHIRVEMNEKFKEELEKCGVPWGLVSGGREQRLQALLPVIANLLLWMG